MPEQKTNPTETKKDKTPDTVTKPAPIRGTDTKNMSRVVIEGNKKK